MNSVCGETRYSDSPNSPHGLNIASPTGRGPSTNVFTTNMAILRSAKGADVPIRFNGSPNLSSVGVIYPGRLSRRDMMFVDKSIL